MPKYLLSRRPTPLLPVFGGLVAALASGCGGGAGDFQAVAPVASVTVAAPRNTIEVGDTMPLTAAALDAVGTPLEGRSFGWTTADATVAEVSETGLVTGLAPGEVEIRATTEGIVGSVVLTVRAKSTVPPPPPGPVTLGLQEVATGLDSPLYLTSPPGDERLFIVQKAGAIRIVKGGTLLPTPFLDLTGHVSTGTEQGLLGLAFPPDYASTGRFVVHYTDLLGNTQVSVFRVSNDPDRADPASETIVLTAQQPRPTHNGGQILFGPDGYLYLGLGDGGGFGDPAGTGQKLTDRLGDILRLDVSSGTSAVPPSDNPFVGRSDTEPAVWSYGLRNPWRFSFDRATGDLYVGDVGESKWEEVNYSSAAQGAGRGSNYGWSLMEGRQCYRNTDCNQSGLALPLFEYDHGTGCAIIGGYVYRGSAIPGIQGHYFYADFCAGWVRSFRVENGEAVDQTEWPSLRPGGLVMSFGEDTAGELYVLSGDGRVLRIVSR